MKPRLLDLFCKAGGAGRGYADAGFDVIGVDIEPQPRYPFMFIKASAFEVLADEWFVSQFAAIHASPVCKVHTALKAFSAGHHENQIPRTREMLHSGKPVITWSPVIGVYGRGQGLGEGEVGLWCKAMGIDWMVRDELSQAIPPAYTGWLGGRLAELLATWDSAVTS
jgi:hypothetical protein